ncbi:MAG: xanthine dehydrogenase family protein [Ectothiorhodospiraceae bacterium]|nr:xanthine dehydrogenase family protein [Ectothiorhodospiraceae bacterium]
MSGPQSAGPIGRGLPRRETERLVRGRGRYGDDIVLPRMLHAAFVRSPHAHARIEHIEATAAAASTGVVRVLTGADIAAVCKPWVSKAENRATHRSGVQHAMPADRVVWQGEPVAVVLARSRAEAEDAAELVEVEWGPLPVVAEAAQALAADAPVIHPELGDNLAFEHHQVQGDVDAAFAAADRVIERRLRFGRQTAMTLEPRVVVADYDPAAEHLTVWHSHQSPYQMQDVFSRLLGIPEHRVRVVTPDVGGAFGAKINVYPDEMSAVAASVLLGRPVKFCADRLESFVSDIHSRDHEVVARIALDADGDVLAIDVDDLVSLGAFTPYMRFSISEALMVAMWTAAPYRMGAYRARGRVAYVNKPPVGMFRGVGMPVACAAGELLIDDAARALGEDPAAYRRRLYIADDAYPTRTASGMAVERMTLVRCLDALLEVSDYARLRAEQARLRERGVYRGIGLATVIEPSAFGPAYYGPTGARISVQDGSTVKLEPSGVVRCVTSVTDQGQGTLTGLAQIVASQLGVEPEAVEVVAGDSAVTPYGGGAWASRGMAIGGQATLDAAAALRANVLALAAGVLQTRAEALDLGDGQVRDAATGEARIALAEVARLAYFRQDLLPPGVQPELAVTRHFVPKGSLYYLSNGIQLCHLELDPETGAVRLLGHWAAEDCGRIVNRLLVDEQVRGGIAQGLAAAFWEHCRYDAEGQLLNASLADYLVPTACDLPDIAVTHVETPLADTTLGAKGVGEAGTIGAIGAAWTAVNDALAALGAVATEQPFTPASLLRALRER